MVSLPEWNPNQWLIYYVEVHIYMGFETLEDEVHSIWDLWSSGLQECKGTVFFSGGAGNDFRSGLEKFRAGAKISREGCPRPDLTPPKVRRGVLNVSRMLLWRGPLWAKAPSKLQSSVLFQTQYVDSSIYYKPLESRYLALVVGTCRLFFSIVMWVAPHEPPPATTEHFPKNANITHISHVELTLTTFKGIFLGIKIYRIHRFHYIHREFLTMS